MAGCVYLVYESLLILGWSYLIFFWCEFDLISVYSRDLSSQIRSFFYDHLKRHNLRQVLNCLRLFRLKFHSNVLEAHWSSSCETTNELPDLVLFSSSLFRHRSRPCGRLCSWNRIRRKTYFSSYLLIYRPTYWPAPQIDLTYELHWISNEHRYRQNQISLPYADLESKIFFAWSYSTSEYRETEVQLQAPKAGQLSSCRYRKWSPSFCPWG